MICKSEKVKSLRQLLRLILMLVQTTKWICLKQGTWYFSKVLNREIFCTNLSSLDLWGVSFSREWCYSRNLLENKRSQLSSFKFSHHYVITFWTMAHLQLFLLCTGQIYKQDQITLSIEFFLFLSFSIYFNLQYNKNATSLHFCKYCNIVS